MVAKLLAHAPGRDECIQKLVSACERTTLLGIRSNLGFLKRCLEHPVFRTGGMTTGFLAQQDLGEAHWHGRPSEHAVAAAALVLTGLATRPAPQRLLAPAALWLAPSFLAGANSLRSLGGAARELRITPQADGVLALAADAAAADAALSVDVANIWRGEHELGFAAHGIFRRLGWFQPDADSAWIQDGADAWRFQRVARFDSAGAGDADGMRLLAPMSGRAIAVRSRWATWLRRARPCW